MKVLMFGWEFPPFISGGLGTACAGLTKGLDAVGGVQVTFVLPKTAPHPDAETLIQSSKITATRAFSPIDSVRFVEIDATIPAYISPAHQAAIAQNASKALSAKAPKSSYMGHSLTQEAMKYANNAAHALSQFELFDVIHAHDWLTFLAGVHAKKVTGKPLVVHIHSTEFDRSGENSNKEIYKIERFGMDMADKIIAVSNYTRDVIIDRYGQDPNKIVTIYNATEKFHVPRTELSADHDSPLVTFLGRITYQKGPEYFVEAARLVLEKNPATRFVMAGDGDLLPTIKSLVSALGIAKHFEFPGFINSDQVHALLARSSVYVMPSVSEPFGIAALEAIHAFVPVVLSNHCGLAECISNVMKVHFEDCEAMADAILQLLDDPDFAERLAVEANKELHRMSWIDSASDLKDVYSGLIS